MVGQGASVDVCRCVFAGVGVDEGSLCWGCGVYGVP